MLGSWQFVTIFFAERTGLMGNTILGEWTRRKFFAGLAAAGVAGGLNWSGEPARAQEAVDGRPVSGFLGDYSKLVPDPNNGNLLFYKRDPTVLKDYHKFIFDPVNIYLLPESRAHAIDADDLYRLAEYFREAVMDELKKSGFEFVKDPGPGVLELNFAITDVSPTGGTTNAVVTGAATAASIMVVPGIGLAVPRLSVGRVSIEGEMLDSVSRERMVAFVTSRGGRRWFSGLNRFRTWGDIQRAFRAWAREFREHMEGAHGAS
jgi:Protein of unknown function (DUF3313)